MRNRDRGIKELCGELDFSFHVVSTSESSPAASNEALLGRDGDKGKRD